MKKSIWYSTEAEYIGATGVESVREMAELAVTHEELAELLEVEPTVEALEVALSDLGVRACSVPVAMFKAEVWDSGSVVNISMDARPGRGRIKVLGANL